MCRGLAFDLCSAKRGLPDPRLTETGERRRANGGDENPGTVGDGETSDKRRRRGGRKSRRELEEEGGRCVGVQEERGV